GLSIFGSLLSNQFAPAFRAGLPPEVVAAVPAERLAQFQNPQALLNPQAASAMQQQLAALGPAGAQAYGALLTAIKIGLVGALHDVFLLGSVLAAVGLVTVFFLKELPLRKSYGPPASAHADGALPDTAAQVGHDAFPSLPPLRPEDQPET